MQLSGNYQIIINQSVRILITLALGLAVPPESIAQGIAGGLETFSYPTQPYSTWPYTHEFTYSASPYEYHYTSDPFFYRNNTEDSTFICRSPHLEYDRVSRLGPEPANHWFMNNGSRVYDYKIFYPPRSLVQTLHQVMPTSAIPVSGLALSSSISPTGDKAIVGSPGGVINVFDWVNARPLPDVLGGEKAAGHESAVVSIAFSPDGMQLLTASTDNTARMIDARNGRVVRVFEHDSPVEGACFSTDGKRVATGCRDGLVRIWEIGSLGEPVVLLGHGAAVTGLSFNLRSDLIVSSDVTGKVVIHNVGPNPSTLRSFQAHLGPVAAIRFRPPNEMNFATAGEDGTVRLWHSTGKMLFEFADHRARVNALAFTPDGLRLLTGGEDRMIFCYFIYAGRAEQRRAFNIQSAVRSISVHSDARAILICGEQDKDQASGKSVVYKMDLLTPEATTGLIVANPVVDRQYHAALGTNRRN